MNTIKFTATELNNYFGFNPETDADFEKLNIAEGSEYVLNESNGCWQVITNGLLQGSFEATEEDILTAICIS